MSSTGRPAHRPSTYSQETVDLILGRIRVGESLRSVCRDPDLPGFSTVKEWLAKHPDFAAHYARAMEVRADFLFDEMLHIADTPLVGDKLKITGEREVRGEDDDREEGELTRVESVEITRGDMIEHRRLQIETRKWTLARMNPRKYGDKIEVSGNPDAPLLPVAINLNAVVPRANLGEPDA